MYGPTENAIGSTTHEMRSTERDILIGKPITNTQVYVLDQHRRLLPLGAVGELFIGGQGLVRGYLDLDELTRSKFIASPFGIGERLTGPATSFVGIKAEILSMWGERTVNSNYADIESN